MRTHFSTISFALTFIATIALANEGCSSTPEPVDPGANQNLQQAEKPYAKNYLQNFRSLDSATSGVDTWDLDLVKKDGKSYVVVSAFRLPADGDLANRTPSFDVVVDDTTVYFRAPSPEQRIQFTWEQAQAIRPDIDAMMAISGVLSDTAGTKTSSLHALDVVQNTGCTKAAVVTGLKVLGTALVLLGTASACAVLEVPTLGAATVACAVGVTAMLAGVASAVSGGFAVSDCLQACSSPGDGQSCTPELSNGKTALVTCRDGKSVSFEVCKNGCALDGHACL